MWILVSLGALALATRWSPAARWMTGAVGVLAGIVAVLALVTLLLRVLLIAGLAIAGAVTVASLLWAEAGPVLAIATGGLTFIGVLGVGLSSTLGRWI